MQDTKIYKFDATSLRRVFWIKIFTDTILNNLEKTNTRRHSSGGVQQNWPNRSGEGGGGVRDLSQRQDWLKKFLFVLQCNPKIRRGAVPPPHQRPLVLSSAYAPPPNTTTLVTTVTLCPPLPPPSKSCSTPPQKSWLWPTRSNK